MEGYLYKWTNYIKGWRLRFFSVENYILYYSKEENNPKIDVHYIEIIFLVLFKRRNQVKFSDQY